MQTTSRRVSIACGVDIGSTNAKAVAVAASGEVVARSARPTPRGPDQTIDAATLLDTIEDMILEVCGDRWRVATVAVAGVGEDGVLVGRDLMPLTVALPWFDPRRRAILTRLRPELTDDEAFGVATDAARTLVGWAWATRSVGPATAGLRWLAITDYAAVRWTGRVVLSDTLAARTAAWRLGGGWDADRVRLTLGSTDALPEVVATGAVLGALRSPVLDAAGVLSPDAVVVAGGHDHPIGGWGVDRVSPGAILDSMGTAEVVVAQSRRALGRRSSGFDLAAGIRSTGSTVLRVEELARNVDWASADQEVATAIRRILAGEVPASGIGAELFSPGEAGGGDPRYLDDATMSPFERATAVLRAVADGGARAVDIVAAATGQAGEVFAAGGWARSTGWLRLKEEAQSRAIEVVPEPEVTAAGAAILAATAIGWPVDARRTLGLSGAASAHP